MIEQPNTRAGVDIFRPAGRSGRARVLLMHPSADMYGSDRMALETARLLAPSWDVTLVLKSEGALLDAAVADGIPVLVHPAPMLQKSQVSLFGAASYAIECARALPGLAAFLRQAKPDVLLVNTLTQPIWIVAARLAGVPVLCHVRESEPQLNPVLKMLLLQPLKLCSAVVANSRSTRDFVRSTPLTRQVAVSVIYNGKVWGDQPQGKRSTPGKPFRLVVVGRLSERKGQDIAIRALRHLCEAGFDVSLQLVGDAVEETNEFVAELHSVIAASGIADRCSFTGFQADVMPHMRSADAVIVPSRQEPFGTVAVEAMVAGTPVIVSDVEGLVEIVQDGVTGLTFPPDDDLALADRVQALIREPALGPRLAAAGYTQATTLFSASRYASEMSAALNLIRRKREVAA